MLLENGRGMHDLPMGYFTIIISSSLEWERKNMQRKEFLFIFNSRIKWHFLQGPFNVYAMQPYFIFSFLHCFMHFPKF
jgi:hypothetical protein